MPEPLVWDTVESVFEEVAVVGVANVVGVAAVVGKGPKPEGGDRGGAE